MTSEELKRVEVTSPASARGLVTIRKMDAQVAARQFGLDRSTSSGTSDLPDWLQVTGVPDRVTWLLPLEIVVEAEGEPDAGGDSFVEATLVIGTEKLICRLRIVR